MVHVPGDVAPIGDGEGRAVTLSRLRIAKTLQPVVARYPSFAYRTARVVGWLAYQTQPRVRRNVVRNLLPLCDGDLEQAKRAGKQACIYVAQYYVELLGLPRRDLQRFERENLEFVNPEHLDLLDDPGPVVAVSCHTGNAELAVQALTNHGREFVALVEAQRPPEWAAYVLKLRSAHGGSFHETDFTGIRAALQVLRAGGVLGVMGDRDIQGSGICVEFFGKHVKLPRGPWELARRTNAMVFPVFTTRIKNDRFRAAMEEPFRMVQTDDPEEDIRVAVRKFARLLETHLRADPAQWVVLEDFWKVHACDEESPE